MGASILDELARHSVEERREYIESLTEDELDAIVNEDWSVVGRPEQFPPEGDWFIWWINAGRGYGKTRTGSETSKDRVHYAAQIVQPGTTVRWALLAPRAHDVRYTMLEGETGLKRIIPPSWLRNGSWDDSLNKSTLTLTLNINDVAVEMQGFSGRAPESPRGPQFHGGWIDEPGSLPDAHKGLDEDTAVSNLLFGMRLEPFVGLVITGTPRNNRLIRDLRKLPRVIITHGRTRENLHNLSDMFRETVVARYEGTRLGRQELDAEILEGVGVMFQRGWFKIHTPIESRYPWPEGTPTKTVRYWDLAASEESDAYPDPDWTAGAKVTVAPALRWYFIEDMVRFRKTPGLRELEMRKVALLDDLPLLWIESEPAGAGKTQKHFLGREFDEIGVAVKTNPTGGRAKAVRWEILASAAEQGRVFVLDSTWLPAFLDECEEAHPDPKLSGPHDDQLDAVAGAMEVLRADPAPTELYNPARTSIPKPGHNRALSTPIGGGIASRPRNRR